MYTTHAMGGRGMGEGEQMNDKPSPLYVAMLLDHALLTLIVRLLATPVMLAQSDEPCPAGVFCS